MPQMVLVVGTLKTYHKRFLHRMIDYPWTSREATALNLSLNRAHLIKTFCFCNEYTRAAIEAVSHGRRLLDYSPSTQTQTHTHTHTYRSECLPGHKRERATSYVRHNKHKKSRGVCATLKMTPCYFGHAFFRPSRLQSSITFRYSNQRTKAHVALRRHLRELQTKLPNH
jgi:hypothetical protein